MSRLTEMEAFRAVVERGGFAAAAATLGLSKARVSKQVGALERRLGVQLLRRTSRRFSLTEAGERFLADTTRILDDLALAETRVAEDGPRGILRVNAPLTYGVVRLMPVVSAMLRDHADLAVHVDLDDRGRDLIGEGYDVTVRIADRLPDSSLVARRIGAIDHVVCAAPDYLARAGTPTTPDDLSDHAMLIYAPRGRGRRYVFTNDSGTRTVDTTARLGASTTLALQVALKDGAGIAVSPRFAVERDLADGSLVPLLSDWSLPGYAVYAMYQGGDFVPAKTRHFIDRLIGHRAVLADG